MPFHFLSGRGLPAGEGGVMALEQKGELVCHPLLDIGMCIIL